MSLYYEALKVLGKDNIKNYCIMEMLKSSSDYNIEILNDSVFIRLKGNEPFIML